MDYNWLSSDFKYGDMSQMQSDSPINYKLIVARLLLLILISTVALWLSYTWLTEPRDFGVYLSSAKSFMVQRSAWSALQISETAHIYGYLPSNQTAAGLWTPPTVIPFLIPFTLFPFAIAAWLWTLMNVSIAWLDIQLLDGLMPKVSISTRIVALVLYPPMFALLLWGQVTGIVLFGYILFLYFAKRQADGWAGLVLILTTLKPHLGFLAWIFIVWWIITQRRWKVILGFAGALMVMLVFLFLVHPSWWADYQLAISNAPLSYDASTLFRVLYRLFFADSPWVQFAGVYISVVTLLVILGLRRKPIGLLPAIPLLLVYSVVLSPYGWIYDQIVAWPAFVWVLSNLLRRHPVWWGWLWVLIINVAYYIQFWRNWGDNNPLIFWLPVLIAMVWSGQLILRQDASQTTDSSASASVYL